MKSSDTNKRKPVIISKSLILMLALTLAVIMGCTDDEYTPSMSAKIDGTSWTAVTRVTRLQSSFFIISGTSMSGEVVIVTIRGNEEGTYNFSASMDDVSAECIAVYQPDITSPQEDNFASKSGSVTLSKVDTEEKRISGTFEFELMNLQETKSIASGVFEDLKYTDSE